MYLHANSRYFNTLHVDICRLIWNLLLVGKTSIEHILHSHYRAITDINWHTTEPDTVVSTGIDSWLWSWDLRAPEKPVFGELLCLAVNSIILSAMSKGCVHSMVSNAFERSEVKLIVLIAGGTQVKWNRRDANVLASSHMNEVLIWDRRVSVFELC